MRVSKKAKRDKLFELRCKHKLTQAEFAAKCGITCRGYQNIEWGIRQGSAEFWAAVQRGFNVPDEEMYPLMRLEETPCEESKGK